MDEASRRLKNGYLLGSRFIDDGTVDPTVLFGNVATYAPSISDPARPNVMNDKNEKVNHNGTS